ncbi:hypothetical protein [Geothermobacter ehrlichii]|uniref:hypothetical protein n=1 Tax=Geothermobacter ehrlichii TaxID=213224 RepID=UPI0011E887C9|nr:hypothetical protein [Geothermobacter ehrlichii]
MKIADENGRRSALLRMICFGLADWERDLLCHSRFGPWRVFPAAGGAVGGEKLPPCCPIRQKANPEDAVWWNLSPLP